MADGFERHQRGRDRNDSDENIEYTFEHAHLGDMFAGAKILVDVEFVPFKIARGGEIHCTHREPADQRDSGDHEELRKALPRPLVERRKRQHQRDRKQA